MRTHPTETDSIRRRRRRGCALLCLTVFLFTAGCGAAGDSFRLAKDELPAEADRLAGVYVTKDYIEPSPMRLEVGRNGTVSAGQQEPERIYGSLNGSDDPQQPAVSFPGLDGYGIYDLRMPEEDTVYFSSDAVFSDLTYSASDEGDSVEAFLYVAADLPQRFYFHPVYQQADGQIYLLPGEGMSSDSLAEGAQFSHSISEEFSRTENETSTAGGSRFSVTVAARSVPAETELLCMDGTHQILARFSGEELEAVCRDTPGFSPPADTAYLLLCQTADGQPRYEAYDASGESIRYLTEGENGILYPREIMLVWR